MVRLAKNEDLTGIGSSRNSRVEVWSAAEFYWVTLTLKIDPCGHGFLTGFDRFSGCLTGFDRFSMTTQWLARAYHTVASQRKTAG
jgi:hypothetical protein